MTTGPLAGYTIGITADRRADEQMKLLAGRGAECLHGPVIKTHPVGAEDELRDATAARDRRPARPRRVHDRARCARLARSGRRHPARRRPARRISARQNSSHVGRRPTERSSRQDSRSRGPRRGPATTTSPSCSSPARRAGCTIAVQLDGAGATDLCDAIEAMGADVVRVPVYRWSLPPDPADAERLIRAVVDRRVDAVTFTAKPAVENFFEIAGFIGLLDDVIDAMRTRCALVLCRPGLRDRASPKWGFPNPSSPSVTASARWSNRSRSTSPARATTSQMGGHGRSGPGSARTDRRRHRGLAHRPGTGAARRSAGEAGCRGLQAGAAPAGLERDRDRRTPGRSDRGPPPATTRPGGRRDRNRRASRLSRQRRYDAAGFRRAHSGSRTAVSDRTTLRIGDAEACTIRSPRRRHGATAVGFDRRHDQRSLRRHRTP